jgi:nucleoside-diphosphate-sugar epimerase
MTSRAVIAGVTGLIGINLANHLVSKGWEVYGVARKPQTGIPGVRPVAADLLEPEAQPATHDVLAQRPMRTTRHLASQCFTLRPALGGQV